MSLWRRAVPAFPTMDGLRCIYTLIAGGAMTA
jgi:hypothetical protein